MTKRPVKVGTLTVHPDVLEIIDAARLGRELDDYAFGIRATRVHPRRKLVFDALDRYADAVSVVALSKAREVWIATSLRRTDVFIPPALEGRARKLDDVKVCCNPAAARLLTPAELTSAVVRHRRGDWGYVNHVCAEANELAAHQGGEVISVFGFSEGVQAVVKSLTCLLWVSVEASALDNS